MSWGWKLATSVDDALNFLNGVGAYQTLVNAARICAMWKGNHAEFYIFYQHHGPADQGVGWGWKMATDLDDVQDFLCGSGSYAHPVKEAQVAAFWKENHCEFYVFYRNLDSGEQVVANWGWKLASDPTDALNFLNGTNGYSHPVTTARITPLERAGHEEFYIFYQRAVEGQPIGNWARKLATTADDALNFVNGTGAYQHPAKGFEIGSFWTGSQNRFTIFTNQGTQFWLQSPLANERFVQGESVHLRALVTSEQPLDSSALRWSSSLDGLLGNGPHVVVNHLSPGTQTIKVEGYGKRLTRTVRIFADLGAFYQASPSPAEIARIDQELAFQWTDGIGTEERWSTYPSVFDQQSTDPSKLVIYAKLDVLRHQDFVEPLPFTGGKAIYEYFKNFVHTLNLRLDCNFNTGGGGQVSLNRSSSVWDGRRAGTADNPDACKVPFLNPTLYAYVNPLYLLNHEERHNEPGDPGHVYMGNDQMDPCLENGSGHAWAAMYTMWVYKYGKYDPWAIKDEAKQIAKSLLKSRFASTPTHSNPKVQAIVDELMQP